MPLSRMPVLWVLASILAIAVALQARTIALDNIGNRITFIDATASLSAALELRQEWRPRVLSNASAWAAVALTSPLSTGVEEQLQNAIALHTGAWFFATAACAILMLGEARLLCLLGIFVSVVYAYLPAETTRVYPWDLPALFFFTLFAGVVQQGRLQLLPAIILGGLLFKETTLVLLLPYLFLEAGWKVRIKKFLSMALACVTLKLLVDYAVHNPTPILSMTVTPPVSEKLRLWHNLSDVFSASLPTLLLLNGGSLLALFLLPRTHPTILLYQGIACVFGAGMFVCGMILELRVWLELAPLGFHAMFLWYNHRSKQSAVWCTPA